MPTSFKLHCHVETSSKTVTVTALNYLEPAQKKLSGS